jgi:hypothetical protein
VSAEDRTGGSLLERILKKRKEASSKPENRKTRDNKVEWEKATDTESKAGKNPVAKENQSQE